MILLSCFGLRSTSRMILVKLKYFLSSWRVGCVLLCILVLGNLALVRTHGEFQLVQTLPRSSWFLPSHCPLALQSSAQVHSCMSPPHISLMEGLSICRSLVLLSGHSHVLWSVIISLCSLTVVSENLVSSPFVSFCKQMIKHLWVRT